MLLNVNKVLALIPDGKAGLAVKVVLSLLGIAWLTSGPGGEEASDFKAKAEKRRGYSRHYALKGRGRKEHFRQTKKDDRSELAPTRASCIKQ